MLAHLKISTPCQVQGRPTVLLPPQRRYLGIHRFLTMLEMRLVRMTLRTTRSTLTRRKMLWLNWKKATRSKRDQADHLGFHSHWFSSGQHTTAPKHESCFSDKWSENINYVYPRENQMTNNKKCGP